MTPDERELAARRAVVATVNGTPRLCPTCGKPMEASTPAQPAPTYDAPTMPPPDEPPKKTWESWRDRPALL